tara:strand:+ start:592 stop:834 length:243 start_codon:yes stop_codon:yes gene_type:complete
MENEDKILGSIRSKVRQRFLFVSITVLLYSSFVLCYTENGQFLGEVVGDSATSGGLILFLGLIVVFLLLEYIFIVLNKDK